VSIRRGYWYLAGEVFDGPFKTIKEAKEASTAIKNTTEVSIRAMIALERRDETGNWVTVH
jgi:hypothetical protein